MNTTAIVDRLNQARDRLDQLQEVKDEYSMLRDGYIHHNMPDKFPAAEPYIGTEVSEEELQDISQTLVERLVETEEVFSDLEDAKDTLSKMPDWQIIEDRTSEELEREIEEYSSERRQVVEDIFELTEPLDTSDKFDFNMPDEYVSRIDTDHLMFEDA